MLKGLLQEAEHWISFGPRIAIITDETVADLYGRDLFTLLSNAGKEVHFFTFPSGEVYKTRATKEHLENQLFERGLSRDTCILALGGGVVTDLVGYLAATFCRGVPLVLVPTTLLGIVDACIGAKTGVNLPHGKNLVGCLYEPKKILIDSSVLGTLPACELRNGIVEIIKHALLADPLLFNALYQGPDLLFSNSTLLEEVIATSCCIKKTIVKEDPHELGKRRLLNFGHTIGHALEKISEYQLPHGEAVALGLLTESHIAMQLGFLSAATLDKIHKLLRLYNLPLKLPSTFSISSCLQALTLDKKSSLGTPRFALIEDIGHPLAFDGIYCTSVPASVLLHSLEWLCIYQSSDYGSG